MSEDLILIKDIEGVLNLIEKIRSEHYIAFDTETDGIDRESRIIGLSLSYSLDSAYYVVLGYWNKENMRIEWLPTMQIIHKLLDVLRSKALIAHNSIFDCSMLKNNFGVDLIGSVHTDTMILAHLLDENRFVGLKELGASIFGENSKKEQIEMKESVIKNGGLLTKDKYELYKADVDLLGKYGAKDALLTLKLFYHFVPNLYEQGLNKFFYDEESMPLLKNITYQLNTIGLKVDQNKLNKLKGELQAEILEAKAYVYKEITPIVKDEYPLTKKATREGMTATSFNIGSSKQLAWLLFIKLGNPFMLLTPEGKDLCHHLGLKLPYNFQDKRTFIAQCNILKGKEWISTATTSRGIKKGKRIKEPWNYMACGKETLKKLSAKYKWVAKLLEHNKNMKLLTVYVEGIERRMKYGIIRPSFLQHGTTSGRFSSRNPNFQNLPRDDKRIKSCIIARSGKTLVGADYEQLEPRVFASASGDSKLLSSFELGDDFYSVIGAEIFDKYDCSLKKDNNNSFANKYPELRNISKTIALSTTYGTTAFKLAPLLGKSVDEAQEILDNYFDRFPDVYKFMLKCHEEVKLNGYVMNQFGRPRRMPEAKNIKRIYGNTAHKNLPYEVRNLLNLATNHKIQSTGASIINRASIEFIRKIRELEIEDCNIIMQVHDEIIVECKSTDTEKVATILKHAMENTVILPGVKLIVEPKIGQNLAELK